MTTHPTYSDAPRGELCGLSADRSQQSDPSPCENRQRLAAIAEHLSRADGLFLEVIREIDRRKSEHGGDRLASLRAVAAEIRGGLATVREAVLWQVSDGPAAPPHGYAGALDRLLDAAWEFTEQCWVELSADALEGMADTATECVSRVIDSLGDAWQNVPEIEGDGDGAVAGSVTHALCEAPDPSSGAAEASDAASQEPEQGADQKEVERQRRRRRSERRAEQKATAASWPDSYRETLHLQTGLIRRQLTAGDAAGAMEQAAGILEAFVRALYASQSGSVSRQQPIDICLSRLRAGGLISESDLFRLLDARRLIERARQSDSAGVAKNAAGKSLTAVEMVVVGKGDPTAKPRSVKRRIKRRTARAVTGFHADPVALDSANVALAEATAGMEGITDVA